MLGGGLKPMMFVSVILVSQSHLVEPKISGNGKAFKVIEGAFSFWRAWEDCWGCWDGYWRTGVQGPGSHGQSVFCDSICVFWWQWVGFATGIPRVRFSHTVPEPAETVPSTGTGTYRPVIFAGLPGNPVRYTYYPRLFFMYYWFKHLYYKLLYIYNVKKNVPACCESSPPAVSPPRLPWVLPACRGSFPPAVVPPRLPWIVPVCRGSSPPAVGHPRLPWVVPGCRASSPPAVDGPRLPCVVPACRGSSPPAVGRPRLPWFVPACRGSSPRAVVRPRVPWVVPACCGSSPPAVVRPRLAVGLSPRAVVRPRVPWFVPTSRGSPRVPWFVPTSRDSSPPAVFRPTCPSFVRACQPSFMPVSYIVSRVSGLPWQQKLIVALYCALLAYRTWFISFYMI